MYIEAENTLHLVWRTQSNFELEMRASDYVSEYTTFGVKSGITFPWIRPAIEYNDQVVHAGTAFFVTNGHFGTCIRLAKDAIICSA
jgi:hypothetical protein